MVARGWVLLFEGCLVLLIDDYQPQTLVGKEDGGACSEYHVVGFGGQLLLPYLHSLGIRVFGVVDTQTVAEDMLQSLCHLHGQGYLW